MSNKDNSYIYLLPFGQLKKTQCAYLRSKYENRSVCAENIPFSEGLWVFFGQPWLVVPSEAFLGVISERLSREFCSTETPSWSNDT